MRRALSVLAPFLAALAAAAACDSFAEGTDRGSPDAAVDGEVSGADDAAADSAPSADAGADGSMVDAAFCKTRLAEAGSTFDDDFVLLGFADDVDDGGSLGWSAIEGADAAGSLEAYVPPFAGSTLQAQTEKNFPIGAATRARVTFAVKLKQAASIADQFVTLGCSLQVQTAAGAGDGYVVIKLKFEDGLLRFDQNASAGGSAIPSEPIRSLGLDRWIHGALEMTDLTASTVVYRAFVDGVDVTGPRTVMLQGAPDHFRVKCGIDESKLEARSFTDDVTFEMCGAP